MALDAIVPLLTNALGGSAIGAVTGFFSKKMEARLELDRLKLQKELSAQDNDHELEVLKLRGAQQVAAADSAEVVASYAAMERSYEADKATFSTVDTSKTSPWLVLVDVVRGLTRPIITGFLTANSVALAVYFMYVGKVDFTSQQAYDIVYLLVNNLTTCTGLAISWYFAARTHSKSGG